MMAAADRHNPLFKYSIFLISAATASFPVNKTRN
jgi:hypothetical protein